MKGRAARPAAVGVRLSLVDAALDFDHQVGELPVCGTPCFEEFIGGRFSENLPDGGQKMPADNRIVLGADADRCVLRGDELDRGQKHGRIFDVFCVGEDGFSQCLLLTSAGLMSLVENVPKFGISFEHAAVEVRCEQNAVFTKYRHGGLDLFDLSGCQHGLVSQLQWNSCR